MILRNMFHRRPCYSEGNSFVGRLPANGQSLYNGAPERSPSLINRDQSPSYD
jgi:hypothetical protein